MKYTRKNLTPQMEQQVANMMQQSQPQQQAYQYQPQVQQPQPQVQQQQQYQAQQPYQQQTQYQVQQQVYQPRSVQENQKILVAIMTAQSFRAKCRSCQTILHSSTNGEFKKCRCGKVSLDGGKNTNSRRLIGSLDDVDLA